jgi:hypothetical protein
MSRRLPTIAEEDREREQSRRAKHRNEVSRLRAERDAALAELKERAEALDMAIGERDHIKYHADEYKRMWLESHALMEEAQAAQAELDNALQEYTEGAWPERWVHRSDLTIATRERDAALAVLGRARDEVKILAGELGSDGIDDGEKLKCTRATVSILAAALGDEP